MTVYKFLEKLNIKDSDETLKLFVVDHSTGYVLDFYLPVEEVMAKYGNSILIEWSVANNSDLHFGKSFDLHLYLEIQDMGC